VREDSSSYFALPPEYPQFLEDIKSRIRVARVRSMLAASRELILLYWEIGRMILDRQSAEGWGAKVVEQLASDLKRAFPDVQGFSPRNLKYMRAFAEAWPDMTFVQQVAANIPWFHNCLLLDKLDDAASREWYIRQTIAQGWSRNMLAIQIESDVHLRQGNAITNFSLSLPAPQSDLAQQSFKDPYVFDFLALSDMVRERELEQGLMDHIQKFMIEMGVGFAFVGRQVHLEVGGQDYYLDLLFYHLKLRCFVVVDLKAGEFRPEYAGKMNFYLSAVDDRLRHADDGPTLGLLLCKEKDKLTVEYALRDMKKPIGVAEWKTKLVDSLPKRLQGALPSIEQLESELNKR
jgi:predicted nuclease of restriction endonuclease-like (RecB) superfamily